MNASHNTGAEAPNDISGHRGYIHAQHASAVKRRYDAAPSAAERSRDRCKQKSNFNSLKFNARCRAYKTHY